MQAKGLKWKFVQEEGTLQREGIFARKQGVGTEHTCKTGGTKAWLTVPTKILAMRMLKISRSHQSNMYNALVILYCGRKNHRRTRK